jgi:hypothetical protein
LTSSARSHHTRSAPWLRRSRDEYLFSRLDLDRYSGIHTDLLAQLGRPFELDLAVDESKESVIPTNANISTWPNRRPALTHENGASENWLPVAALHAKPLPG